MKHYVQQDVLHVIIVIIVVGNVLSQHCTKSNRLSLLCSIAAAAAAATP